MSYDVKDAVQFGNLLAAADLSSNQYYAINIDSSGEVNLPSAGQRVNGILMNKPEAAEVCSIQHGGIAKCVAGDAVTAGDNVSSDSSGRAITATSGTFAFGTAVESASAAGDIIAILLQPGLAENIESHELAGSVHTAAGLTAGEVVVATAATTFEWGVLGHDDLDTVTATDHHDNTNDPTADEKAALDGTGTPSGSNKFVTADDSAAHRDTIVMNVVGAVSAATGQGGIWEAPAAGTIVRAMAYRKSTAGSSGSTIIDLNLDAATIFTTQANRPEIAFDASPPSSIQTTIENDTFAQGELLTMDVDQIDTGGSPSDLTVVVTVEYSA